MPKRPEIFDELDRIAPLIPTPVYWLDTNYVIVGGNDICLEAIGSNEKDINKVLIGKTYYDYYPKEIADELTKMVKIVLETNQATKVEEKITDVKTGKFRYYETARAPLHDNAGNIVGTICSAIEVTDKKETERLIVENAAHKAELETQAKFITVVNRIAHDVAGSMSAIKKMTKYFSSLKEITSVSGYEMRLTSAPGRESNILYVQPNENGLKYEVLDLENELETKFVSWEELLNQLKQDASKYEHDFPEFQKEFLPILLEYTEKLGLTKKKMNEKRVPEAQRIQLENSTQKAMTIMEGILSKYLNSEENQDEPVLAFNLSLAIHDAFAETRLNYENQHINFLEEFNPNSQMVYIEGQRSQINRAITNLLRNAAQALDGKPGDVILKLDSDEFYVYITIADIGKGMPPEIVDKIKNNIAFTEGKKDGHGIGLGQVNATLNRNFAEVDIISEVGKGTQFVIKFKKSLPPNWAAQTIEITPKDQIIIVDDDPSIHGDWGLNFEPIIEKYPSISIHNFYESQKALDYIQSLSSDEQKNIMLLSDFKLANDVRNGLNVIEESKVKRAFLVTSHCNEAHIQQALLKLNAKLLPKKLNQVIPIIVVENRVEYSEANLKIVDGIWLDDDTGFTFMYEQELIADSKKVDIYRNPEDLMDNIQIYPKNIPILLDNNFESISTHGTDIAVALHKIGFTKLFLVSGDKLNPSDYPYLTILSKADLDYICKYF